MNKLFDHIRVDKMLNINRQGRSSAFRSSLILISHLDYIELLLIGLEIGQQSRTELNIEPSSLFKLSGTDRLFCSKVGLGHEGLSQTRTCDHSALAVGNKISPNDGLYFATETRRRPVSLLIDDRNDPLSKILPWSVT